MIQILFQFSLLLCIFCFENLTLGLQSLSESNDFRANNPISKDFHSTMVSSSWENSTNFYIFKSFLPGLHIWKKYVLGQLYRKVNTFCEDHCGRFVVHSSSRPSKMPENSDEHGYNPLSDLRSWWILIFNIWWCFGGYVNVYQLLFEILSISANIHNFNFWNLFEVLWCSMVF